MAAEAPGASHHGYMAHKDEYLKRLRRIEGQVRGLQRMVEEETYCIDILTQVSAFTKALQSLGMGLLDEHLRHCVVDAAAAGGPRSRGEAQRGLRRHRAPGQVVAAGVIAASWRGSQATPSPSSPTSHVVGRSFVSKPFRVWLESQNLAYPGLAASAEQHNALPVEVYSCRPGPPDGTCP